MSEPTKEQLVEQVIADLLSPMTVSESRWQQAQALRALLREREEQDIQRKTALLQRDEAQRKLAERDAALQSALLEKAEAQREIERIKELCGPAGDGSAFGRVEAVLSYQLSRVAELEAQLADEQEQHRLGVLSAEAQLQAEREAHARTIAALNEQTAKYDIMDSAATKALAERDSLKEQLQAERQLNVAEEAMRVLHEHTNLTRQLAAEVEKRKRLEKGIAGVHDELEGFLPDEEDIGLQPVMWSVDRLAALLAEADKGEGSE